MFSCGCFGTKTRFNTEAKGNSEMAYCLHVSVVFEVWKLIMLH